MKSSARREMIIDLISKNAIETQEDLLELLKANGVETTQATVSRDIKKLNLIKTIDSTGKYRYTTSGFDQNDTLKASSFIKSSVLSVDFALNNVVLKCNSGMAQAACATIDMLQHNLILGTIAGDDTVLIITRSTESSQELCYFLNDLIRS